jgi:hypothetical protein
MPNSNFVFISIIVVLTACNPSSKLVKQGDSKQKQGLNEEASVFYYNALLHKPHNPKVIEGLTLSAQEVLNDKFVNFNKLVVDNKVEEAINAYQNADRYNQNALSVGVNLKWPTEYNEVFADIKSEYVSTLYDQALIAMNDKRYEQAEVLFERIAILDSSYKGITVLRMNTILEPLYQHGLLELQQAKYKLAYQTFSKIVLQDEGYKDAKQLKEEAKQKSTTSIGVLPVYYTNATDEFPYNQLSTLISERLTLKAPVYTEIEPTGKLKVHLENRGWNDISDIDKAIEAGKTLGLKYVVWLTIKQVVYTQTPQTTEIKYAYEAFSENILNPYTGTYSAITKFRKVTYDDTYEQKKLTVLISFKFISTVDGSVVLSDEREHVQKDEVHQLVYKGNINNVYENLPTGNFLPPYDQAWRDLFTNQKRQPLSNAQLANETNQQVSKQITQSVLNYLR